MLHEGNIYLMDYAIKNMPEADAVLEIGSWGGLSTNLQLHLMRKYGRKEQFLGCDPWIYEGIHDETKGPADTIDGNDLLKRTEYMDYIMQSFQRSVQLFQPNDLPYTIRATSDDFFDWFDRNAVVTDVFGRTQKLEGRLAYCYIDGNHAYDFAKRDFENAAKHLVPGGFILLDDSSDGSFCGSARLMHDIKKNRAFQIVEKNPNYLIRKVV